LGIWSVAVYLVSAPGIRAQGVETWSIGNSLIRREVTLAGDAVRPRALANPLTRVTVPVAGEEFILYLTDDAVVPASEFRLVAKSVRRDGKTQHFSLRLAHPHRPIDAELLYTVSDDDWFMRKTVTLRARGKPFLLRDVDVDSLTVADVTTDLGGRGQPVYLADSFFLGLEYPAGFNLIEGGCVSLRHHPGKQVTPAGWISKSAVLGTGESGQAAGTFTRYVERIRIPSRSYLLYNSWYDLRKKEMTIERLTETYEAIRQGLAPYGVKLATFVPDDGWQNPQSIWEADLSFLPQGYTPLADAVEEGGTRLGLWMPFMGTNLDIAWGKEHGYEVATGERYYCLTGPKYNKRLREVVKRHMRDWRVGYFKHDFNMFNCREPGHGHLPEARYGFESNVDAEIEMLRYEQSLLPDVYLNVTSCMWLSPWWLPYADAIWMGCSDFGRIKTVPATEPRDWAITYRDHHLWRRFRKERAQFPMSAVMTHGVIYGRRLMLGGKNEPLDTWSDNVAWFFLRGMQMKELYITPSLLNDVQWDILGRACRWAEDHTETLRTAQLILGDPGAGEVYGFSSRARGLAFFGFRNPSLEPQVAEIAARELIGQGGATVGQIYPFRAKIGTLTSGTVFRQALGPNEIRIYRADLAPNVSETALKAAVVGPNPVPVSVTEITASGEPFGLAARVDITRDDVTSLRLVVVLERAFDVDVRKAFRVECDGTPVKSMVTKLDGLQILEATLPRRPLELRLTALPTALDVPFQPSLGLRTWLIADWSGTPGPAPDAVVELACPYAARRRGAVPLGEPAEVDASPRRGRELGETDLRTVRAGKLHLFVFGSNGDKYAGKAITLNGERIGDVPTNPRPLDRWKRCVVDIPQDKLASLRLRNQVRFGNSSGDSYKLRDVALAVQLADGAWVETPFAEGIHCSTLGWLHAEGKPFKNDQSQPIAVQFQEK